MKGDRAYLLHMRDACDRVLEYAGRGEALFLAESLVQDAILRNLQVIGEAARRVSEATRAVTPRIPWRAMTGMQNRLVHDYFEVDLPLVWQTAVNDIPAPRRELSALLEHGEPSPP